MKITRIISHVLQYDMPEDVGLLAAILRQAFGAFG